MGRRLNRRVKLRSRGGRETSSLGSPRHPVRRLRHTRPSRVAQDRASAPVPIALQFIGVLEQGQSKWAILSDGKGQPMYAKEGQIVLGQYKPVKIGGGSVTTSNLDGMGVQRILMVRDRPEVIPRIVAQDRAVEEQIMTDHPASAG